MYKIKEIYYTLQCEGFYAGRAAVFCRFTGCNLWSGREQDRAKAQCQFCDTDFIGTDGIEGGKYSSEDLAIKLDQLWNGTNKEKLVVFTGGEPLLQLDDILIEAVHQKGFEIAVETNGTIEAPKHIDWICFSPKANTKILLTKAHEIKIVFPQLDISPFDYENFDTNHFYLQPMDNKFQQENTIEAVSFCKKNPKWKLSLQLHKFIGID